MSTWTLTPSLPVIMSVSSDMSGLYDCYHCEPVTPPTLTAPPPRCPELPRPSTCHLATSCPRPVGSLCRLVRAWMTFVVTHRVRRVLRWSHWVVTPSSSCLYCRPVWRDEAGEDEAGEDDARACGGTTRGQAPLSSVVLINDPYVLVVY